MPRNKKRKHEESDAITVVDTSRKEHKKSRKERKEKPHKSDVQVTSQSTHSSSPSPPNSIVSKSFENFNRALSNLLSTSSATLNLHATLGDEKANFVVALQTMKSSGDLPWLEPPTNGDSDSAEEGEIDEGEEEEEEGKEEKPAKNGIPTPNQTHPETELPKAPPLPLGRPASLPTSTTAAWPPPLPTVHNESLRLQAFTHKSFIKGEDSSLPGTEQRHYERLEFLGDSYLQSIASHLLYNRFPTLREGSLSDMRQQLVANRPLSTYATMYKFHNLIREGKGQENVAPVAVTSTPPSQPKKPSRRATSAAPKTSLADINKTLADCFEAYIAAIILDDPVNGMANATNWLAALYEPKLREMEIQHSSVVPIDKMAKQTLNTIAGGNKVMIEYKWTDGGGGNKGGFWITVLLTGWGWTERVIGRGWGSNKSDAALRAAMNVIANKEFCEEIVRVKLQLLGPKTTSSTTSTTSSPAPPPPPPPTTRPIAENGDILNYDD